MSSTTTPNSTTQLSAPIIPKLNAHKNQSKQDKEEEKQCPIQVVVRCRPLNEREKSENARSMLSFPSGRNTVSFTAKGSKQVKDYSFDYVYPPEVGQEDVFNTTVSPIVEEVLKGFNCTIFAYGQTGTGKTYTMEGFKSFEHLGTNATIDSEAGIIPRAIHQIFKSLEASSTDYTVRVSFLELYNEELNDLLSTTERASNEPNPLKIYEDPQKKVMSVQNLEEVPVNTAQDIFRILERGLKKRQVAETNLNKNSSRSHSIFSVIIHSKENTIDGEFLKVGKLNLVDLAGSENIGRSGAQKERKREAGMINQSLLTLGRVITALTDHSPHIPYRESKLTRLLQDSLGGRTKTCIIATVSPSHLCMEETISTLEYACRAKHIKNTPTINQKKNPGALIKDLEAEIARLNDNLIAARSGTGFYVATETYTNMQQTIEAHNEMIKQMEAQVQALELAKSEIEDLFTLKQSELREKEQHLFETKMALMETSEKLNVTAKTLTEVQEVVEDQKVVIEEHEQVEKTLQENNATLINTLQETMSDVDGLYSKIDRKKTVEEENKRRYNEFNRFIASRSKQTQSQLDKFRENQSDGYSQLASAIQTFVEEKDEEISFLRSKVDQLWSLLTESQRTLQSLTESHRDTVGVNLHTLQSSQISHLHHVEEAAEIFLTESAATIGSIRTQLTQHKHEVSRWETDVRSRLHHTQAQAANFVGQQKESLSSIKNTVRTSSTQQKARLQSHQQSIQRILSDQQDQSKQFQETLLQQMSQLMSNFVQTQQQQLNRAMEEMNSHIQSESTVLDEFCSTVDKNTEAMGTQFDEHLTAISSDIKAQEAALDVNAKHVDDLESFVVTHNKQLEENTTSSIERLVTMEKNRADTVQQTLQKETSALQEYCQLHHNAVNQFLESEKAVHEEFGTQLENTSQSLKTSVHSWAEQISTAHNGVECFHENFSQDIAEVKTEICNFFATIKEDKPTGTTPVKKLRTFPTNIPKPRAPSMLGKKSKTPKGQSVSDKENTTAQVVNTL